MIAPAGVAQGVGAWSCAPEGYGFVSVPKLIVSIIQLLALPLLAQLSQAAGPGLAPGSCWYTALGAAALPHVADLARPPLDCVVIQVLFWRPGRATEADSGRRGHVSSKVKTQLILQGALELG